MSLDFIHRGMKINFCCVPPHLFTLNMDCFRKIVCRKRVKACAGLSQFQIENYMASYRFHQWTAQSAMLHVILIRPTCICRNIQETSIPLKVEARSCCCIAFLFLDILPYILIRCSLWARKDHRKAQCCYLLMTRWSISSVDARTSEHIEGICTAVWKVWWTTSWKQCQSRMV